MAQSLTGWRVEGAVLQPDETVAGYLARDVDVRGRCYLRNCKRSYWIDLADLVARGMGQVAMRQIQASLRCNCLTGCNLYFEEHGGAKLTLGFLDRESMFVRFACSECQAFRLVRAATLIRRLTAEKRGGRETLLCDLEAAAKTPCETCKAKVWAVDAIWAADTRQPAWLHQEMQRRQRLRDDRPMKPGEPSRRSSA